jgi:phosphatidate cytidylyltransferase
VDSNLKSRLVTAFIGIPLLIALVGWGSLWLFVAVCFLLTVAALREYFAMVFPGRRTEQVIGILFGSVLFVALLAREFADLEFGLSLALIVCFSTYLFVNGKLDEKLSRLTWTVLGGLYLGYLLPHWVLLFRMPRGRAWVFFLLLVIMLGDTAAYFVGRRFGSKKLAPEISPGKTVEGAWGYVLASVAAGCFGAKVFLTELPWLEVVLLSVLLSILGQLGDLFESWLKRVLAVKDSGTLLPGHGGLLDRLDSLIFPAVFTTTYLKVFHS